MLSLARHNLVYRTVLVTQFAGSARRPVLALSLRIGGAYLVVVALVQTIIPSIRRADLPVDVPLRLALTIIVLLGFMLSGLLFLALHSNLSSQSSLRRLFRTLAIPPSVRFTAYMLPSLVAVSVIGVGGSLCIAQVARGMQLSAIVLCLGWIFGLLAGYGLTLCTKPNQTIFKAVWFLSVIAIGTKLLEWLFASPSQSAVSISSLVICGLVGVSLIGYWQQYVLGYGVYDVQQTKLLPAMLPRTVPFSWWFILKLVRNRRSRQSFCLVFGISCALALFLIIRKVTLSSPVLMLNIPAMLAATFACDVRGITRRYVPTEMMLFGSLRQFTKLQTASTFLASWIIGLPMLYALNTQVSKNISFGLLYLVFQSLAASIGLLASTIFVAAEGEVGGQFFSAMTVAIVLTGLPRVWPQLAIDQPAVGQLSLLVALVCLGGVTLIEIIRRNRYGRT